MSKGLEVKILTTKACGVFTIVAYTAFALDIFYLLFFDGKVRCHKLREISVDFVLPACAKGTPRN